jgi:hypothetical protein
MLASGDSEGSSFGNLLIVMGSRAMRREIVVAIIPLLTCYHVSISAGTRKAVASEGNLLIAMGSRAMRREIVVAIIPL